MNASNEDDANGVGAKPAPRIGYGITQDLVWKFVRPNGTHGTNSLHFDTDNLDRDRILSVFGIRETTSYPFDRFRDDVAVAALRSSEEKYNFSVVGTGSTEHGEGDNRVET